MDLEFLSKASSWANAAVVVFTLLAAVAGVAAWHFSSQYRVAKDTAFERFKLQSAVSIAESAARTAEASKRASEAEEETAKAVAEAASANERTKALEVEAGKQRERATEAQKKLVELQERTKPRQISEEQRSRLMTLLVLLPLKDWLVSAVFAAMPKVGRLPNKSMKHSRLRDGPPQESPKQPMKEENRRTLRSGEERKCGSGTCRRFAESFQRSRNSAPSLYQIQLGYRRRAHHHRD